MDVSSRMNKTTGVGDDASFDMLKARYRSLRLRRVAIILVLISLLVASFCYDIVTGSSGMTVTDFLRGVLHPSEMSPTDRVIIWNVRLPFSLMALLVGAGLSLAGAEMQVVLNNPPGKSFHPRRCLCRSSGCVDGYCLRTISSVVTL